MHDEREMDRVLAIDGVKLIGINNRNLGTLSLVDIVFVPKFFSSPLFFFSFGTKLIGINNQIFCLL